VTQSSGFFREPALFELSAIFAFITVFIVFLLFELLFFYLARMESVSLKVLIDDGVIL